MSQPFDLKFFRSVQSQRKAFLVSKQVQNQKWPQEISLEIDRFEKSSIRTPPNGNLWVYFFSCFRQMFLKLFLNKFLGRVFFASGLLFSQKLLTEIQSSRIDIKIWLGFTLAMFGNLVFNYFSKIQTDRLTSALGLFLTNLINRKLIEVDHSLMTEQLAPAKIKVLLSSDIRMAQGFLSSFNNNFVPTVITLIVFIPLIIYQIGWLGWISILIIFAVIPVAALFSYISQGYQDDIQKKEDLVVGIIGEWVRNIRVTRFLNLSMTIRNSIAQAVRKLILASSQQHVFVVLNFTFAMIWWMIPIASLFYLSQRFEVQLTLASLFSVIWLLNEISNSMRYLPFTILSYSSSRVSVARIMKLLASADLSERYLPDSEMTPLEFLPVRLHLNNIEVIIDKKTIFKKLNLTIFLNKKTAMVGNVASGKSVLARVLIGELHPASGTIQIELENGRVLPLWSKNVMKLWQDWISYVPQQVYISNDKLRNNITLGEQTQSPALLDAIHLAQLEVDIASFNDGLDEEIGESGNNLSGGQKQRLGLARALYFDRNYCILDNPTSSIDGTTQSKISEGIAQKIARYLIITNQQQEISQTDYVIQLGEEIKTMTTQDFLGRSK